MLQGMDGLHRLGRAHSDLKPANILVSNSDDLENLHVVIIDIGGSMVQGTCKSASRL